MATSKTMRAMFERLGFTPVASASMEGNDHGINALEEVVFLNDKDIDSLVKQLRRPGGMIAGHTLVGGAAQGNPGPLAANPGHSVSVRAETNLKLALFYLCHQARISRFVAPASVALTVVRSLCSTKEYEENFKVTADQPLINEKYWPGTMEEIRELFVSVLGETGVPLAYVVRENVEIPPGTDPSEGYITVAEEMIARVPHGNQAYANDSMEVWRSYMAIITQSHDFWTYVKPAQRTKDGRHSFLLVWNHFLGPNNVDNMASEAEAKLVSVSYTGERKRWTWEKYVQIHAEQHAALNGLTEYGYSGIDNGTKVRKLMAGIKNDALYTVKAAVLKSPALRTNYPDVVNLYGDFIKQQKIESSSMNVSDAHITCCHNGPASVAGSGYEASYDGVVEDRFYNRPEYRTFSPDQKNDLRLKRKHRVGDDNGRSKGNDRRSNGKRIREEERKKYKKTIKSLTRTIAALYCKTDDLESSSDEASVAYEASEPPVKSNRTNSSLTRQRGSIK
jgi:hypothetical protein